MKNQVLKPGAPGFNTWFSIFDSDYAGVAQLVERQPSKLQVAGSNLVSRSFAQLLTFSCLLLKLTSIFAGASSFISAQATST
jgi:hypothetical protein